MLVTRWQNMNLSSQHGPTTDESTDTGFDYDYILNENDKQASMHPTQFVLPLLPIVVSNDSIEQDMLHQNNNFSSTAHGTGSKAETSFREENNKTVPIDFVQYVDNINQLHIGNNTDVLILNSNRDGYNEMTQSESDSVEKSTPNIINHDQEDLETVQYPTTFEYSNLSPEDFTPQQFQIFSNDANNEGDDKNQMESTTSIPTTDETTLIYSSESSIEMSQTEDSISGMNRPTDDQFVDYIDAMLLNDSLLLTNHNSSYFFNTTDEESSEFTTIENDKTVETTTLDFSMAIAVSSYLPEIDTHKEFDTRSKFVLNGLIEVITPKSEKESIDVMQSNMISDNSDEGPYKSVTENVDIVKSSLAPPPLMNIDSKISKLTHSLVRFPTDDEQQPKNILHFKKIKFPDETQTTNHAISWPRDNGFLNFWRDQPLISDSTFKWSSSRGLFSFLQNNNRER